MTAQTPSLGELLRQKIARDEQARLDAIQAESEAKALKERQDTSTVERFFANAQSLFTSQILGGLPITPIQVGRRANLDVEKLFQTYKHPQIDKPEHPYHAHWQNFAKWAAENGLEPKWSDDHDGIGVQSWHWLTVIPITA